MALGKAWEKLKGFRERPAQHAGGEEHHRPCSTFGEILWDGLKKGATTGEWGDFWKAAVGAAEFAIGIMATLKLAGMAGAVLWSSIQTALKTAGFSTAGIGTAGLIAMVSVGLAVVEAMRVATAGLPRT